MALVTTERRGRVALLTLNDPERRNAMTLPMVAEIVAAMDEFEADDGVGAIIVTGAPPAFCAGADLGDLGSNRDSSAGGGDRGRGLKSIYEGFLRVARSPLPTLAAVNGAAVGAGMNLALGCDVRLAGASARFDSRFVQLGLHPGGGHTWLMERALGPHGALAVTLFGDVLKGPDAERCGLAWRSYADDELLDAAVAFATKVADAPRPLVERVKQSLRDAPHHASHAAAVDYELEPQLWSVQQPFFAERLAAMQAKISSR